MTDNPSHKFILLSMFSSFRDVLSALSYSSFYFRVKEVRIIYDFCSNCNVMKPQTYLEKFTEEIDTSGFCLAHLFTYKDFPNGIAGYGWIGKLCSSSHNTGFTTFLNHEVGTYLNNKSDSYISEASSAWVRWVRLNPSILRDGFSNP